MTTSEACKLAGKHWTTIQRWIKKGYVSAVKDCSGHLVIDESSLRAHLAKTSPVKVK